MAERTNQKTIIQAMSIEETVAGEYLDGDDGAAFRRFLSNATNPILPTRQKVEDMRVGGGNGYKRQGKPYEFDPRNIPVAGALDSETGVRILRDFQGGTITETVNTVPATKNSLIHQKAMGEAPRFHNHLRSNGGEQLLHGDTFVAQVSVTQQGKGEPQLSATLQNGGHYAKLPDTDIDVADIEPLASYYKYNGNNTRLTFTDGVSSFDYANEKRLIDSAFEGNQGVIIKGLPNDPYIDTTNQCKGSFTTNIYIGEQSGIIKGKVYMDTDFDEFEAWEADRKLTNVRLKFQTCEVIGSTTHHAEITIIFPKAQFNLEGDVDEGMNAFNFTIEAIEGDDTTGDLIQIDIRQVGSVDETI